MPTNMQGNVVSVVKLTFEEIEKIPELRVNFIV